MTKKRRKSGTKSKSQKTQGSRWLQPIPIGIALIVIAALVIFVPRMLGGSNTEPLVSDISVSQAYDRYQEGTFFLDVRTLEEWQEVHIEGATFLPLDELEMRTDELPRDEPIIVYCRTGNRSSVGRDILRQAGFEEVGSMNGGISQWISSGYPVVKGTP